MKKLKQADIKNKIKGSRGEGKKGKTAHKKKGENINLTFPRSLLKYL